MTATQPQQLAQVAEHVPHVDLVLPPCYKVSRRAGLLEEFLARNPSTVGSYYVVSLEVFLLRSTWPAAAGHANAKRQDN